jgi:hypothetical protein
MKEGSFLGFNLRSRGRSAEGFEMGIDPTLEEAVRPVTLCAGAFLIRGQASNDAPRGLQVRPKVDPLVKGLGQYSFGEESFSAGVSTIPLNNLSSDGRDSVES